MRKLGDDIQRAVATLAGGSEAARLNMRVQQVLDRYRAAIENVYRESAALHLAHTNKVVITKKDGARTLIVYVDDSLFAAELNAQRELIKLQLLELFGEELDDFQICTSRWKKYRDMHPYLEAGEEKPDALLNDVPLDAREASLVSETAAVIEDERLRKSLEKAMTADLEWKKAEKYSRSVKNSK